MNSGHIQAKSQNSNLHIKLFTDLNIQTPGFFYSTIVSQHQEKGDIFVHPKTSMTILNTKTQQGKQNRIKNFPVPADRLFMINQKKPHWYRRMTTGTISAPPKKEKCSSCDKCNCNKKKQ